MGKPPMNLREQIQSQMIHGFVLGLLKPLTKEDFKYIIKNKIDIIGMFSKNFDFANNGYALKVFEIIKNNKHRIDEYLNVESMLEQMKDHRPDLYEVFNTKEGIEYLNGLVNNIRKLLKSLIN